MKSEKEIKELLNSVYPEIDKAVLELQQCVANKDWSMANEWLSAIQTGILTVSVSEAVLS